MGNTPTTKSESNKCILAIAPPAMADRLELSFGAGTRWAFLRATDAAQVLRTVVMTEPSVVVACIDNASQADATSAANLIGELRRWRPALPVVAVSVGHPEGDDGGDEIECAYRAAGVTAYIAGLNSETVDIVENLARSPARASAPAAAACRPHTRAPASPRIRGRPRRTGAG
jgi:hypothetical protein